MNKLYKLQAKLERFKDSVKKCIEEDYDIPENHAFTIALLKLILLPFVVAKQLLPWVSVYLLIQILNNLN